MEDLNRTCTYSLDADAQMKLCSTKVCRNPLPSAALSTHPTGMKNTVLLLTVLVAAGLLGCSTGASDESSETPFSLPALETHADSLAMMAYDAAGGPEAFAAIKGLRFDFGVERMGTRVRRNSHLWDRTTGDYRLEYMQGEDSSYVVLFNINSQEGQVYLNGTQVADSTDHANRLSRAYRSFVNDTYWLLAPVKMLDPGVTRTYEADSSDANIQVVKLTFEGVGLTPGDQYWMYLNADNGQLVRWAFVLQGNLDAPARAFNWMDYDEYETPAGPVTLSARKNIAGQPASLLTDAIQVYSAVPEWLMSDPTARLVP